MTGRGALPEEANYVDTGCSMAPSCLRCPFARCRYDLEGRVSVKSRKITERHAAILDLDAAGATVEEIAAHLGVSRRTVFRVRSEARDVR